MPLDRNSPLLNQGLLLEAIRLAGVTILRSNQAGCPACRSTELTGRTLPHRGQWRFTCRACGVKLDVFQVHAIANKDGGAA